MRFKPSGNGKSDRIYGGGEAGRQWPSVAHDRIRGLSRLPGTSENRVGSSGRRDLSHIGDGQGHEALTRQFQHLRSFPAASRCVTGLDLLSFAGQLKLLVTTESYELIFLIFASAPKADYGGRLAIIEHDRVG